MLPNTPENNKETEKNVLLSTTPKFQTCKGIVKNMLWGWNLAYQLSRECQDFIIQFRKTEQIPPKPQTQNTDGTPLPQLYQVTRCGTEWWALPIQFIFQITDLPSSGPERLLPGQQSARRDAWARLCCCPRTAEVLNLVHFLLIPRSGPRVLQSLPNQHSSEMIFPWAVKILKSEWTAYLNGKLRDNEIFILLNFPLKSKGSGGA